MKKIFGIILFILLFSLTLVWSTETLAVCEQRISGTDCGTRGQRPYFCQQSVIHPIYCCDFQGECVAVEPEICPEGYEYVSSMDQCCLSRFLLGPNCTITEPPGSYCAENWTYNPSDGLCYPPGATIDPDDSIGARPSGCVADGGAEGIETALGCIPVSDANQFIIWLVRLAIGLAGGIAILLMIFAGFQIITSAGDPKRLQAGKELLGAAIAGLLIIIFSVFLLELIGVRILQIPGFG